MTICVKIPVRILSEANNRDHWYQKLKRKKKLWQAISIYLSGKKFPLPCKITLERIGPRKMDDDNLAYSFKSVRDAVSKIIIEAHFKPKASEKRPMGYHDSDPRLFWHYGQKKGPYAFTITIEPHEEKNVFL